MKKKNAPPTKQKQPQQSHSIFYVGAAIAILYGVITAYQIRWLCDDIFITLRYVQNWLAGNGIVYNVGERVEGYTHFLWMCLIAFFQLLGSKPEEIVKLLGVISYAGTLLVFIDVSRKIVSREKLFVPLTAILLALNFDFKIWATGGLETSLFTFLISASLWSMFIWKTSTERALVVSGLLLVLALMTRPDGVVFLATAGVFVAARSLVQGNTWKQFFRTTLLFGSAFIIIYLPYFVWKYFYYGDIFPNTYYAKSGGASYYSQGFTYIWVYLKSYLSSFVALLGLMVLFFSLKQVKGLREQIRTLFHQPLNAMILLSLGYILLYGIFFVARVGGDFMYARFLHPIVPMMYIVGELSLYKLFTEKKRFLQIALIALPLLVLYEKSLRDSLFIEDNGKRKPAFVLAGITDEYWYWTQTESMPVDPITANEIVGKQLEYYFRGEQVGVLLRGQASLGYYAKFPLCVENAGLTDSYIAHLQIENRGRPGHEKNAPVDYLLKRGVHFVFFRTPYDTAVYRRVFFRTGGDYSRAEMFFYDAKLMNSLRSRFPNDVVFTDFQQYLDDYLLKIKQLKKERVVADYETFRKFYFQHNSDALREKQFTSFLGKS
jgi:hypothetical protein